MSKKPTYEELQKRIQELEAEVLSIKESEKALKKSYKHFQALLNNSSDYILISDDEGFPMTFNVSYAQEINRALGIEMKPGLKPHTLLQDKKMVDYWNQLHQRVLSGEKFTAEYTHKFNGEGIKHFEIYFTPVIEDDTIIGFTEITRDVTKRKQAEEETKESEAKMKSIFQAAPIGIGVVSRRILMEINDRFCDITGYRRDELIGENARMLYPTDEEYDYVGREKYRQIEDRGTGAVKTRFKRKDGKIINVLLNSTPIDPTDLSAGVMFTVLDITDRKRVEEMLSESEKQLITIIEASKDAMIVINIEGLITLFNPASEKMFNRRKEEMLGQDLSCLMPESYRSQHEKDIKSFFSTGLPDGVIGQTIEVPAMRANGEEFPIEISLSKGGSGEKAFVVGIIRDITKRKLFEDKLRISEKKYRRLYDSMIDGFVYVDMQGRIQDCNQSYQQMLGYNFEELAKLTYVDLTPEKWHTYEQKIVEEQIFPKGYSEVYEKEYRKKDGTIFPVELRTFLIKNDAGQNEAMWAIVRDISERKQAEQEKNLLISAIEQASESIIISNEKGTIQYVNPSFLQVSGFNENDLIGQNFRILKSEKNDDAFYREMYLIISNGKMWSGRITNKMKDGTLRIFETSISPVRDRSGKIINYVSVNRDITQMVELESQFQQSQKMETVGLLAGGIAHDFNNLLTTIIGNADFALDQVGKHMSLYSEIEEIRKAGRRAAALTRQLLAFSRKQLIQPEILNLNDMLMNTDKMLRRTIGEDIEFKIMLEPELWDVKMDPGQTEQTLMNLVVNARDAMPTGGKLTIETANVELDDVYFQNHAVKNSRGSFVMIAVTDTGTGMDEETRSRIFEPFFTTKEKDKGTGLGLSTIYGIVKQNNGHIGVYSEPGKGTTFKIYFPRINSDEASDIEKPLDEYGLKGSETILAVEDSEALLKVTKKMLEKFGYNVLTARNGNEAMEIFNGHDGPIHLLLTDVVMPDMNGRDLAEQIHSKNPKVQVLYMSGYTDDTISKHGVLYNDIEFIEKPFSAKDLGLKVRAVLDQGIDD